MSELKETVLKITNTIARTSGELIKSTRLSIALASEEDKLKALYVEIGKKVHEIYTYGGTLGAAFDENVKLVEEQREKIKDIKTKIDAVKGTKTCQKCGKSMDHNAEFCPKCGRRAEYPYGTESEAPAAEEEPYANDPEPFETIQTPPPVTVKTCALCGKENTADLKFCYHCGRAMY